MESYKLKIVLLLTVGFILASLLGYITQRIKLSPMVGYLLGGYLIGPYSPGFEADLVVSEQLAEIGVILMMFGVGLHFRWEELSLVKGIAIPGAIGQTFFSALSGTALMYSFGWPLHEGFVLGVGIGVASTVVLIRVLSDHKLLDSQQGHIAVGWLIVEDLLTVIALILLPLMAEILQGDKLTPQDISFSIAELIVKVAVLVLIVITFGHKVVSFILSCVARTKSNELFTLTVLALTFAVATGSSVVFGTSIALGAFIAGMVIGRTNLKHQALANSLGLKDVFSVIFFLSIGMLFNPDVIWDDFIIVISVLFLVLFIKPLIAFIIVAVMKYPIKVAVTVAIALGQVGEFSFILAEEASRIKVLPDDGYDIIVACALVSIALNPVLFRLVDPLSNFINHILYSKKPDKIEELQETHERQAIVVGYGVVGQEVVKSLSDIGFLPIVIDQNIDIIEKAGQEAFKAIYGEASHASILLAAQLELADLVVITIGDAFDALKIVHEVRRLRPHVAVMVMVKHQADEHLFHSLGVNFISSEHETSRALNRAIYRLKREF